MRLLVRSLVVLVVLGLVLVTLDGDRLRAQPQPPAVSLTRVLIYDNGGSFAPGDPATGQWGFIPFHLTVMRGDTIEFVNPAGNARPHTVTSITWTGQAPTRELASGARFDSSPTRDEILMPGSSWSLSTAELDPGHYLYYCTLHPWMVGTFTVTPAP